MPWITDNGGEINVLEELRVRRLDETAMALDSWLDEESAFLLGMTGLRRTALVRGEAYAAALQTYVDHISHFILRPRALTADDILTYRCAARAWAVAQRILEDEAAK